MYIYIYVYIYIYIYMYVYIYIYHYNLDRLPVHTTLVLSAAKIGAIPLCLKKCSRAISECIHKV